jgi:hypothetical protein
VWPGRPVEPRIGGWEDRERDAENLRHGTPAIRITEQRLTRDPDREAARLKEILDRLKALADRFRR